MSKELVIGSNRHETKVAILEEDQLVEVYFQRANEYSLAGSIHKGRVTRVLPGMQSAFVDLGLERDTFLYVSDFFEENEDIDTLEEKPVRGDRRERGQGRSTAGRGEERTPEPALARTITPERTEQDGGEAAEEEKAAAAAELTPTADAAESGPGERVETERGFRGDRRGRRSRRRRQRGRGFPENKYAQPASSPPIGVGVPESPRESTEAEQDVMILPGESLAKYRGAAWEEEAPERAEAEPDDIEPADIGSAELSPEAVALAEEEAEEQEAIEEEAEEIALTDKVFGHNDELSPAAEEEKIEEVREDQPPPSEPDDLQAGYAQSIASEGTEIRIIELQRRDEQEPAQPGPSVFAIDDPPFSPELEAAETEEFPAFGSEESLEADGGEAAEGIDSAEPPRAQTAEVRERGGGYMHRVSRRMRRRRGGNRFPQASASSAASADSSSAGTATAAALQTDTRRDTRRETEEDRAAARPERETPSISELLKPGQEIIVQIAKEPLGQKGARITSHVALPGRYVVFMPSVGHLGVSRKIASDEERHRLKRILQAHRPGTTGGFIVRTAGEGVSEQEIAADMNFLYNLWLDIRQKAEKKPAPVLLHYDLDIVQRVLRDQVTDEFKAIWVDNEEMYENVVTFMERFQPELVHRVKMYTRSTPVFDAFNITQELEKALRPKVWLKSGGYIVINQTEALVAIDINTGKYVGKSNRLEDTIVKTNAEAVKEIVRQIRLRDLGGIIVVDFIDMDERKNRQKVMQVLEEAMRADKAPYKILQFNDFGLVAITRKRVKQSLERTLCSPCPYCEGAGYVKSVQTVIGEILVEAQKIANTIEGKDVVLRVHPDIAKVLKARDNEYLEELEEVLRRPVLVKGDLSLNHEKFDLG
ncbi:MAG TPA: Rne/Rng family ribonuclease [Bryobacteraceae bacterium]|jgi:ribonuclease G|nr:Rne/Rng family ribonuclease [Bryobacteraceae bacterium]